MLLQEGQPVSGQEARLPVPALPSGFGTLSKIMVFAEHLSGFEKLS